ncbi:NAD(P)-binding protein [Gyrodon lividus]|nr:NAD(P)-binding protein [Gyrodon lividus]
MGLLFSKSFNPITDMPDLSGKVIIVTGGNTGIGYATVKHLARLGAKVYMAARNKSKAEEAIAKLKQEGLAPGNGQVVWLELDLSDPRNVKNTVQEFLGKESRLDVLIHNAAILVEGYKISPDGVQEIMIVNAISPFVLTRELLPVLKQTAAEPNADVRIVVVSSAGHELVPGEPRFRNFDDINNEYKNALVPSFARYCYTKLANILYASELQRRLDAEGSPITVISLHPGSVNTFSRKPQLKKFSWLVDILVYPFFVHPDVGGYTSVIAAASPEVAQNRDMYKGAYLVPIGKIKNPTDTARDEGIAKELWELMEGFVADRGI